MSLARESSSRGPQRGQYRSQNSSTTGFDNSFLAPVSTGSPRSGRSPNGSSSGLTPTSAYNTTTGDYFGETWQNRRLNKFGEPVTAMSIQYITTASQRPRRIDDVAEERTSPLPPPKSTSATNLRTPDREEAPLAPRPNPEQKRSRGHRSPTQKNMLSKALAKANNAVLLDNSSQIDGAIEAYAEACDLLQQVMARSSDPEDRKKLSAIRKTYSNRIAELHDLEDPFSGLMDKELPDDPPADDANATFFGAQNGSAVDALEEVHIPPRAESLLPQIYGGERYLNDQPQPTIRKKPVPLPNSTLRVPMDSEYMPPPLSPRRLQPEEPAEAVSQTATEPQQIEASAESSVRNSSESTSWLDTIDDGEGIQSQKSSFSRLSDKGLSLNNNSLSNEIEAEFDAALNAAVDAAYDSEDVETENTPKVEQKAHLFATKLSGSNQDSRGEILEGRARADSDVEAPRDYLDEDTTEEEERLLDEMTEGYTFDDFTFDSNSKSALPRQSDSSTFSGRTQASSNQSTTLTAATNLSTLAEDAEQPKPVTTKDAPLPAPPELGASPPKTNLFTSPPKPERLSAITLRDRRLSGQNALKIETYAPSRGTAQSKGPPRIEIPALDVQKPLPMPGPPSTGTVPVTPLTSIHSNESLASESPATPALTQEESRNSTEEAAPQSPSKLSKMMPPPVIVRKNLSSTSLRQRNPSISASTDDQSPMTPASAVGPGNALFGDKRSNLPPLPTPTTATFGHQVSFSSGMHLFDDNIGIATSPRTPKSMSDGQQLELPTPLEPCPEAFLLRPWWLMRCLYQVVAHPRGGHLTNKMFLPRDIWRVKNVKLRFLEDKISQCDILTAALLALAKVDNYDADAMLDALQSFEIELDKVRGVLQKKLGGEVGVAHSNNVFKSPTEEDHSKANSSSSAAKSFASGWRKLRSKSSSTSAPTAGAIGFPRDPVAAGSLTMPSLPMTSSSSVQTSSRINNHKHKIPPPTPSSLANVPVMHATYMSSLARLFDAVQILDAIARQVEDPGLKASDKTHVGLEFCVRNAAEFFSFYIIRFVMADVCILVDKFLKRGAEWVMN